MPRLVYNHAEWVAIAHELAGAHRLAAPPGLVERVQDLLREAPGDWPDQIYALELDAAGAEAIAAVHAALGGRDPRAGQRSASVAEAAAIVRDHQRRP